MWQRSGSSKSWCRAELLRSADEADEREQKNIKIKEAENKMFYLPIGKYKMTISKDKASESKSFEILNPKK